MISTFGGFSMAKLGIRSSQQGLHITGNNITNINTNGYTRQRINQVSLYGGVADRYSSSTDVRIGMGSLVTSVSQIRDPFLDIRYRNEASNVGFYEEKLNNLDELKAVLDEVSKDGIHTAFEDIRTQLNNLANNVGSKEHDTLVRSACQKLVSLLNKYSADLNTQKQNSLQGFDQNVDKVNTLLSDIQKLNIEIRKSQIHGDNALEMIDQRNMLIDELSTMAKIKVTYVEEKISAGTSVNRLKIELDAPGTKPGDRITLIDGEYANKLKIDPVGADGKPDPNHTGDYEIDLGGLTNLQGDSPVVAELRKQMVELNQQVKSLNAFNKKFDEYNAQRQDWTTAITAAGWKTDDFGKDYDTTLQGLKDAIKNEKDPQKKKEAQEKLRLFNKYHQQNQELTKEKAALDKQRDSRIADLEKSLTAQGLKLKQPVIDPVTDKAQIIIDGQPPLPADVTLVDPNNAALAAPQFSVDIAANGDAQLKLDTQVFGTKPKAELDKAAHVTDNLYEKGKLFGLLQADLEYLNGKGEFEQPDASEIRGIAYYQRSLDTLAQTFANTMNDLNKKLVLDKDGKPVPDPKNPGKFLLEDAKLFDAGDPKNPNKPITASNIKISQGWLDGTTQITASVDPNAVGKQDNTNIHNIIAAINSSETVFNAVDANGNPIPDAGGGDRKLFTGSFESMFTNMNAVLGSEMSSTGTLLNNYALAANERAVARDNLSTVDLNEEGINLVQYQKSFQAACRFMTTLDEMLQSILNIGVGG